MDASSGTFNVGTCFALEKSQITIPESPDKVALPRPPI
jgi:hypothetical protein